MARHGKNYNAALKKVEEALTAAPEGEAGLEPVAACTLVRETSTAKFDATIEAHVRLGVDPRHADQMVRSTVSLPRGTGKTARVLVFATGEKAREATEAGADFVGADDLTEKIQAGWTDFDVAIATPDIMAKVTALGRVLGPRGLMPNAKTGTITFDIARAVKESKGGRIEFRTDKFGIIHAPIGKASFEADALQENFAALIEALVKNKPSAAKGQYLKKIHLAASMGPAVPVDVREAGKLTTG